MFGTEYTYCYVVRMLQLLESIPLLKVVLGHRRILRGCLVHLLIIYLSFPVVWPSWHVSSRQYRMVLGAIGQLPYVLDTGVV